MRTPRACLAIVVTGILVLGGCSASDSGRSDEAASDGGYVDDGGAAPQDAGGDAVTGADSADEEAPASDGDSAAAPEANADSGGDTGTTDVPRDSDSNLVAAGHAVVTTATVGVQVEDPYAVLIQIADYATQAQGWEVNRQFRAATETSGASGAITVMLPPTTMADALEHLATYGEVGSIDLNREDVTLRVRDVEARIRVAQMMLDRAEGWLAAATTPDAIQQVEGIYNERLLALEDLLAQQATDAQLTAMSTLNVQVYSPEAAPPEPEPEVEPETGFLAGLRSGWDSFYEWGSDALRVIGVLLPWLVFLALIGVGAWFAARPVRRRRAAQVREVGPAGPTTALPPAGPTTVYRTAPSAAAPESGTQEPPAPQAPPAPPA